MGIFTWYYADKPEQKLPYGGIGYIACPDGTFEGGNIYDGYGVIGGHDPYELVVDWNKDHLPEIVEKLEGGTKHHFGVPCESNIALAYAEGDMDKVNQMVQAVAERCGSWYLKDWKRSIGIMIACEDEDNDALPYPIKITSKPEGDYKTLPVSHSTQ